MLGGLLETDEEQSQQRGCHERQHAPAPRATWAAAMACGRPRVRPRVDDTVPPIPETSRQPPLFALSDLDSTNGGGLCV